MQELKKRNQKYEDELKSNLGKMCQGPKPWNDILSYVMNEHKQSKRMANFRHEIKCFKEDGVYQLNRAVTEILGVAENKKESAGPSGGEQNMETVSVQLADGTIRKVPYGKITLPDAGEGAYLDITYESNTSTLLVTGTCQFRFSSIVDSIVDMTEMLLNTNSIYKNQILELNSDFKPKIIDLSHIDKSPLIISKTAEKNLVQLYARLEKAEELIKDGIPLKTGILIPGEYGTGKTLLAGKIARRAIKNNWIFIYLKDPLLLARTLKMAKTLDKNGWGIVLFLEDVDQVVSGNRDAAMQDILNTLDGVDTKGVNVISIFTTNHIEKINPTFLRGKRIGTLIPLGPLDADMAKRFINETLPSRYIIQQDGIDEVCKQIAQNGIVPAFMAEIMERVQTNLVYENDKNTITAEMIEASLESYLIQVKASKKEDVGMTVEQQFADSFTKIITNGTVGKQIKEIHDYTCCD